MSWTPAAASVQRSSNGGIPRKVCIERNVSGAEESVVQMMTEAASDIRYNGGDAAQASLRCSLLVHAQPR